MQNLQPIEKRIDGTGETLDVHSVFYTIQGEGPFSGKPAVFVRLAGCNLQCPGCDTNYTSPRKVMSMWTLIGLIYDVKQRIINLTDLNKGNMGLVVITGGEPFRQPLGPLIRELVSRNFMVQVETNGTMFDLTSEKEIIGEPEFVVVCSPKTTKVHSKLEKYIDHYKYVLDSECVSQDDGLPTHSLGMDGYPARPHSMFGSCTDGEVWVSPMDSQDPEKNKRNVEAAVASCMKYGYRLSLQTHKLLGLP